MGILDRLFGTRRKRLSPDGYQITEFPAEITEYLRLWGAWGNYAQMYRSQPAVRTVVDFLGRNCAQLTIEVFERISETSVLKLYDHDLARMMRRPAPQQVPPLTSYMLKFATVADLGIYDRAYWYKVRDDRGRVRAVTRLRPMALMPDFDYATNTLRGFKLAPSGKLVKPEDLVIFHGYTPDGGESVPPLETLRLTLAEEHAATRHREGMWRNSARQSGIIQRPLEAPEWSLEARERFMAEWAAHMSGAANAGRSGILEDGMVWNPSSFSAEQSQYIQARKLTREEVAAAYHIAPPNVGILDHGTLGNVQEGHAQLYQDTLPPILTRIEEEIDAQLLPEFERFDAGGAVFTKTNLEEKLRGSFEKEASLLTSAAGGPWMTRNEVRVRKGLPRIDDPAYDELIVPMNVTVGGQPAPNVPTEVPQPGPKLRRKATDQITRDRDRFIADHITQLTTHFERQRQVVKTRSGAETPPLLDRSRWDKELADDIFPLAMATSNHFGELTAKDIGGTFDSVRTENFWKVNVQTSAANINQATEIALVEGADVDDVYDDVIKVRVPQIAITRVTHAANWAMMEAAGQNGYGGE